MGKIRAAGLAVVLVSMCASAGPAFSKNRPLFDSDAPLKLTISSKIDDLTDKRKRSKDPYDAVVIVTQDDGSTARLTAKINARGESRRTVYCAFPPLSVEFTDKSQLKGTVFRGQKTLKLVTHCKPNKRFEEYTALEYLAYRIFDAITPLSFGVRMAEVTYADTEGDKPFTQHGFFIEDADDVADRNDLKELKIPRPKMSQLDPATMADLALFQYLISNLDWSVLGDATDEFCCHNGKLLGKDDQGAVYPIPYDFDLTGFVDPPYALPPAQIPVPSVRTRYYWGLCIHNAAVPAAIKRYQDARAEIFRLMEETPYLDEKSRKNAIKYVEGFYEIIDDPDKTKSRIIDRCRS